MNIKYKDGVFVCYCQFEHKDIPKNAGFRWDRTNKVWSTPDVFTARKLKQFADSNTTLVLMEYEEKAKKSIELSKASEFDVSLPCNEGMDYLPFQKAGIVRALEIMGQPFNQRKDTCPCISKGVLIADDMGL